MYVCAILNTSTLRPADSRHEVLLLLRCMCRDGKRSASAVRLKQAAGDGEQERRTCTGGPTSGNSACVSKNQRYIPPPCISQASREEALEVSSGNGRSAPRSRARSACSPLVGTSWVSQDAHEVGEGSRAYKRQTAADHGRQHAHSQTGKSCHRRTDRRPGVHKAQSPG